MYLYCFYCNEILLDIQIIVEPVTGKGFLLKVKTSDNIRNVKTKIQYRERIIPDQQHLLFAGKEVENNQTLSDCNIRNESILYLILTLGGKNVAN